MFAPQLTTAVNAASLSTLDKTAQLVWRSLSANLISDEEADALSMAIEARREALRDRKGRSSCQPAAAIGRPRQRSKHQSESVQRRRRHAGSGALPPQIIMHFTTGEAAVLSVIARQVQRKQFCDYFMDKLAAIAGVSRTTVRNALRRARELGFLLIEERRVARDRNLSNLIRIISNEWIVWLGLSGCRGGRKELQTTSNHFISIEKTTVSNSEKVEKLEKCMKNVGPRDNDRCTITRLSRVIVHRQ